MKRTILAFLPSNLDLQGILNSEPPDFRYHLDNFKYLLSLIYEIPAYNREIRDQQEYTNLNAKLLQGKIHNYKQYLTYLLSHGILETDHHYIRGEKSTGYRFTKRYSTPVVITTIKKSTLVKAKKRKLRDASGVQGYEYLTRWFNKKLDIDVNLAMEALNTAYLKELQAGNLTALRKYNASFIAIHKLDQREYFTSVDSTSGRFHSNLTNLSKLFRKFITYDKKHLTAIDIVNSQPMFSSTVLRESFYQWRNNGQGDVLDLRKGKLRAYFTEGETRILQEIKDIIRSSQQPTNPNLQTSPLILEELSTSSNIRGELPEKGDVGSAEVNNPGLSISLLHKGLKLSTEPLRMPRGDISEYIALVEAGVIYEGIRDKILLETGDVIVDRDSLKELIFQVLFSDNRFFGQKEAKPKRVFQGMFPCVYKIFSLLKKGNKPRLARLLQRIESTVILRRIAKRISEERPDFPIFTIHDSIVCLAGNEEYVEKVISEEVFKSVLIASKLKREPWW